MSYPIYKINIPNENIVLHFCLEEEMKSLNSNDKCMNMYIYEDDTLIEIINKIKIGIINHIEDYNDSKFEELVGYLTTEWNYYNDIFKLKEYVYLNIFDNEICTLENFINKLEKINKKYDIDNFIGVIDKNNLTLNNIDFDKFENIEENNEIVIGYYDRNITNFYKYYITKNEMNENIGRIIENELNKPINSYYNIRENIKENIVEYNFYIVRNDEFIKNNYVFIPNNLVRIGIKNFMENIYINNNKNRIKLHNTNDETFCNQLVDNISYLSLEINHFEYIDFKSKYNFIELNENIPFCLLSQNEKNKTSKKYKLFKNKKSKLPFITEQKLSQIIEETNDSKKKISSNYTLFKIYFIKNKKKTTDFIDVFLLDKKSFYIKFQKISYKIDMNDIIENINNILLLLKLEIADKKQITLDEFYYYNDNNTIKLNDIKDFNSNKMDLLIKSSYIVGSEFESEKFLYFLSVFNSFFDIELKDSLQIQIKEEKNTKKGLEIKKNTKIVKEIKTVEGVKQIKLNQEIIELEKIDNLKIINNKNIRLLYKKSYNYDSYNYMEKFFKYIITFKEGEIKQNFKCKESQLYNNFLINYGENEDNYLNEEIEINGGKKKVSELIDEIKNMYINKLVSSPFCDNIKNNINKKCSIEIKNISTGIFSMELENIYSFRDLDNICNLFQMYVIYSKLYNKNYNFKKEDRLIPISPYIEKGRYIYNIYNNIYNKFNILHSLNENVKKSYYIYSIYENFIINITHDEELDLDDLEDFDIDLSSDEEFEDASTEDEDEIENYSSIKDYIRQYNTQEDTKIWIKEMTKYYTGTVTISASCRKNQQPSIITGDSLKIILENEGKNKIKVKSDIVKPFTEFFEFDKNKINLKKFSKEPLELYMGRKYIIDIKNEPNEKKVLLFEDSNIFISEYNESNTDKNIYLEIKNKENNNIIKLSEYLENEDSEFEFIINFPLTEFNQENIEITGKTKINKSFKFGIYKKNEGEDVFKKDIQRINLKMPKKYYYDDKIYNDNYFVYLPKNGDLNSKLPDPRIKDNIICCFDEGRAATGAPSVYKNLNQNKDKTIEYKETIDTEEKFYLEKFKIAKIPNSIYENMCSFLSLENKNIDYYKDKIISQQPYRFGILKNMNINNFLHAILVIMKIADEKYLPTKIKNIFNLKNDEKSIHFGIIRDGFINCINDPKILNDVALIKLNNNVFYKNDEKMKSIFTVIKNKSPDIKTNSFISNSTLEKIRKNMIEYIQSSFLNLDIYFIWNLCSIIFNINIIVFELEFKGNTLFNNIKCPLVNNYKIYEFDNNRKTCFIFKFNNTYQPLTIPLGNIHTGFIYNILFNINDEGSFKNINNLFKKCSLKYNNNSYNTLLVNSIYHNIDYSNHILINTEEIFQLKKYIKYIVINEDYIKLGLIFNVNEEYLFIPINYLKHNINYNIINNDFEYKFIYSSAEKKFIHNFEKTKQLVEDFYELHKMDKLQLNNKYITKNENIIGIGLLIGDYIPIESINITDIKLDIDSELKDILIEEDISYINTENNLESDLENYNKFEYTNLYYTQFIHSILHIIQNIDIKKEINKIINEEEYDINDLINYLKNILKLNFTIKNKMYLENNKPTHNIESNIVSCHTLQKDICKTNNNNCEIDSDQCKYIITQSYYDLFIKFLANDLYYNYYKKNILLSIDKNDRIINFNDNKYITFEEEKEDKERKVLKNKINKIYNKIITDDHYYSIGENYNKSEINIENIDKKHCRIEKFNENLNFTYYDMKSLTKKNIIAYSNCIYYNLSEIENIKMEDLRTAIGNEINKNIKNNNLNLYDIINYYLEHNNSHLYTNIKNSDDLFNILTSSEHWMTEFDLYIYSKLYSKKILFYKLNVKKISNYDKGCYMIMNNEKNDFTQIKIYEEDFYYRKLYYLIKNNE